MEFKGGCHCGRIRFSAKGDIESLLECNCSLCAKRGSLLWFIPRSHFSLETPTENLSVYTFNKHQIKHHFCSACGCSPFSFGSDPKSGEMAAINARCINDIDVKTFKINFFDGKSY